MTRTIDVRNPRTGEIDYRFEAPTGESIARECVKLREAQKRWAAAPLDHRLAVMRRWADVLEKNGGAVTKALALDTGRWRMSAESPSAVVASVRAWCDAAPGLINPADGRSSIDPGVRFRSQYKPFPLLGVISPWNVPFILSMIDAVQALIAGCAAIIKPSEVTPRFVEPVAETVAQVPELDGVLTYVQGDGEVGQEIIDNVDIVVFTGSVATGRKVAEAAARRFIPVFLELGGKDPVIITKDADIERAATATLRGSVFATGQLCYSIERVYVDRTIHDAFVDRLVEKAEAVDLSFPDMRKGHIGPLIFARQADIIDSQLDDAVDKGAVIRTGGKSETLGGGKWIRPTVLTDVDHSMEIMTEETFGPVIPVMAVESADEAVELANDTTFGLSGAVIAGSEEEAQGIASQIDAGAISVMDTGLTATILRDAEKTSFNLSGLGGTRMGPGAIMRFFRKKAIMTNTGDAADISKFAEELAPQRMD